MHVEPPGHAPQSLKDFAKHYLMIVLGILTAVGIEQGLEAAHYHRLATQTTQAIEEELRSNLVEATKVLAQNRKRLADLEATEGALTQDILAKNTAAETFAARVDSIAIGVATPSLRRDAWDAAIASQALSHVDAAKVRRFSEGYTAERDAMQAILSTLFLGNWAGELSQARVLAKLGQVDQVGLLKAVASYRLALAAVAENERELTEAFGAAVGQRASD